MPTRLSLEITSKCPFRCKHCVRDKKKNVNLPLPLIEKALSQAKIFGVNHVSLTGGEPLAFDKLDELFDLIKKHGYKCTLITSGFLFKKKIKTILKYKEFIDIAFSLDGSEKETHDFIRHEGSFERVIQSFKDCSKNEISFIILSTLNKKNKHQIKDLVEIAINKKASQIRFSAVLPCENSLSNHLIMNNQEKFRALSEIRKLQKQHPYLIATSTELIGKRDIVPCLSLAMKKINIDPLGNLIFCCVLSGNNLLSNISIGNLKDNDLVELLIKYNIKIKNLLDKRISSIEKSPDDYFKLYSCRYCIDYFRK